MPFSRSTKQFCESRQPPYSRFTTPRAGSVNPRRADLHSNRADWLRNRMHDEEHSRGVSQDRTGKKCLGFFLCRRGLSQETAPHAIAPRCHLADQIDIIERRSCDRSEVPDSSVSIDGNVDSEGLFFVNDSSYELELHSFLDIELLLYFRGRNKLRLAG